MKSVECYQNLKIITDFFFKKIKFGTAFGNRVLLAQIAQSDSGSNVLQGVYK